MGRMVWVTGRPEKLSAAANGSSVKLSNRHIQEPILKMAQPQIAILLTATEVAHRDSPPSSRRRRTVKPFKPKTAASLPTVTRNADFE
jgi:hypothetical protein